MVQVLTRRRLRQCELVPKCFHFRLGARTLAPLIRQRVAGIGEIGAQRVTRGAVGTASCLSRVQCRRLSRKFGTQFGECVGVRITRPDGLGLQADAQRVELLIARLERVELSQVGTQRVL